MELFSSLFVGHLVGDFLLQTTWMAEKKDEVWLPLIIHCFLYTAAVALFALLAGGLSILPILVIFISHIIIDKSKTVDLWAKYITRSTETTWLRIIQDQVWHLLILVFVTLL